MPARLHAGVLTSLAALACVFALAACGGSSKPKQPSSHANAFIGFSKCMRAHGVSNFPDPTGGGGIRIGNNINPQSPVFRAAQTVCSKLLPGGGPGSHKPSAAQIADARKAAECMREHGVSGYPDPIVSSQPPDLSPAQYSQVSDQGGIIIAIPKAIDPQSPAFQKAAKICNAGP
jgi:hypothetical protein